MFFSHFLVTETKITSFWHFFFFLFLFGEISPVNKIAGFCSKFIYLFILGGVGSIL
jgi:hypothetical protein